MLLKICHFQVWKKEFSPCEGELSALRRGEAWDPVKFQQEKQEKEWRDKLEEERSRALNKVTRPTSFIVLLLHRIRRLYCFELAHGHVFISA